MAALNRGRYVVEHMQQTPSVADGLAIMAQAYILLDFNELAKDSITVLHENFPDHPSLNENGDFESVYDLDGLHRSWINQLSLGLFDPQNHRSLTTVLKAREVSETLKIQGPRQAQVIG